MGRMQLQEMIRMKQIPGELIERVNVCINQLKLPMVTQLCLSCQQDPGEAGAT